MTIMWVNDRDLEVDFSALLVEPFSGWADISQPQLEGVGLAGFHGQKASALGAASPPQEMTVGIQLDIATLAGRRAALDALVAQLAGEVQLRFADDPTRFIKATFDKGPTEKTGPAMVDPDVVIPLHFLAFDPLYYSVYPKTLAIPNGQRVVLPIGTAGGTGFWMLRDVTTDVAIVLRARSGEEIQRCTLTGNVASTEALYVDGEHKEIWLKAAAGGLTSAFSRKTVTDAFPNWDPADGVTAELFAGAGTPRGMLLAREAYKS